MDRPGWRFPTLRLLTVTPRSELLCTAQTCGHRTANVLTGVPVTSLPALGTVRRVATWYLRSAVREPLQRHCLMLVTGFV